MAGGFTCGTRILILKRNVGELEACQTTAEGYPECALCHPERCPTEAPTGAPETSGTDPTEPMEPTQPSNSTNSTNSITEAPTPTPPEHCGCYECSEFWGNVADGFTCKERIEYEMDTDGYTEEEACRRQSEKL